MGHYEDGDFHEPEVCMCPDCERNHALYVIAKQIESLNKTLENKTLELTNNRLDEIDDTFVESPDR